MKPRINQLLFGLLTVAGLLGASAYVRAEGAAATENVSVRMTVTSSVASGKRMPEIGPEDILVSRGNERLPVTEFVPATGSRAGLDLFLLIDDASDARLGLQFDDLETFINQQPPTTSIGVGYMSNATVQIAQNLTTDHALAVKALRLPFGSAGPLARPYLSVADLMRRWPPTPNRREVVMVTDGADHTRRHSLFHRQLAADADVDIAAAVAQRTGTVIYGIYTPGAGRAPRDYSKAVSGQMNLARLSDQTGGVSFIVGVGHPVRFKPYLDDLQRLLDNQYLLGFSAVPAEKAGLQQITLSTALAGVELFAHDAVWVPVRK